jgi:hypothetical protein
VKLTIEEHREIAKHCHAIDHHLDRMLMISAGQGSHAKVPIDLIESIEAMKEEIGASSSPSGQSCGSLMDRFEESMMTEWPEATLEIYHGDYADCVTLAMDAPYRPPN